MITYYVADIIVSPSVGFIAAGGAHDITITLQPQNQQIYSNLMLTAFIPGCKVFYSLELLWNLLFFFFFFPINAAYKIRCRGASRFSHCYSAAGAI